MPYFQGKHGRLYEGKAGITFRGKNLLLKSNVPHFEASIHGLVFRMLEAFIQAFNE